MLLNSVRSLTSLFPTGPIPSFSFLNDCPERKRKRRVASQRSELLETRTLLSGSTFIVSSLADDGDGSLRQAIEDANNTPGEDSIKFEVEGIIGVSSQLEITDDVVIDGPGAENIIVSGGNSTRVFAVLPSDLSDLDTAPIVSFKDISINDGLAHDAPGFDPNAPDNPGFAFGGGLYNMGGTVSLYGVHMTGNVAANVVTAGGAVANEFGGTLNVKKSHFEGNSSSGFLIAVGGAITSDLGPTAEGGTTQTPNVHIRKSSFIDNSAVAVLGYIDGVAFSGLGGGGALLNVTGTMTVENSLFEGNRASGGTGGDGSTLGGAGFGGAILSGDFSPFGAGESSLNVRHSSFDNNEAIGGQGAEEQNGGEAAGGAISAGNGTDATIKANSFDGNSAIGGDGEAGGVGSGGAISGTGTAFLELKGNDLSGNLAEGGLGIEGHGGTGRGGAFAVHSLELAGFLPGAANATSKNDDFDGNQALGGIGGGVFNEGDLTIKNGTFSDNEAIGLADVFIAGIPGYNFQGSALGGGISNVGVIEIENSAFSNNVAIGADGASGPNVIAEQGTVPIFPGIAVGGAIHNISDAAITRTRLTDNAAIGGNENFGSFAGVANGGGIYNDGVVSIANSHLTGNAAVGGNNNTGDINAGGGYGGGITSGSVTALVGLRSASLSMTHTTIIDNAALGGFGNSDLFEVPAAHAASGGTGGGILVYQGTAEINKSRINKNTASGGENGFGSGGGIFSFGFVGPVNVQVSRSKIQANTAIGGENATALGGGIASASLGSFFGGPVSTSVSQSKIVKNSVVVDSDADALGGGVYNGALSSIALNRTKLINNLADGGGLGIGIGGGFFNDDGNVDLFRTQFHRNLASTSDDDCFGC